MALLTIEKCLLTFGTIGAVCPVEGGWILRRERHLTRIDRNFKLLWDLEFRNDAAASILRLACHENLVMTYRHPEDGRPSIACYEVEGGQEVWNFPFAWQGLNSYGGLMQWQHRLFVAGDPAINGALLSIDLRSGKLLQTVSNPPIDPKGPILDMGQQGLCQVGQWLFSRHRNKSFFRANLDTDQPQFELLPGMEWSQAGTDGIQLFWEGVKDGKSLSFRMDPHTMEVKGCIPLDPIQPSKFLAKGIRPINGNQAILWGEEGIALLDYEQERIRWHRKASEIGKSLSGGIPTSLGLIFLRQAKENVLLVVDPETGKTLDTVHHKEAHFQGGIFQIGEWIVANAIAGLILLRPENDAILPAKLEWVPFESAVAATQPAISKPSTQSTENPVPKDTAFSKLLTAFVNAKAAQEQGRHTDHARLATEFNLLFDAFTQTHPEASIADVALKLSELGVPYEDALADVVRMRA